MPKCISCGDRIEGPRAIVEFADMTNPRMNGITYQCHTRCLRFVFPEVDYELPARVADPVADFCEAAS